MIVAAAALLSSGLLTDDLLFVDVGVRSASLRVVDMNPSLACFCLSHAAPHAFFVFSASCQIVLPTLAKLLGDPQAEVRQAAGESLVGVANLMKPIDLGHHVLTIVLQLAHDDEQVWVFREQTYRGVFCMYAYDVCVVYRSVVEGLVP